MRVGYTGWTWISNERDHWKPINDRHKENFEQFLREVSDLGYETVENFNWIADYYGDDIEGFKQTVLKYNLKFENLYFYFSNDPEKDYLEVEKYLKFMKQVDAHYMNMQGVMWEDRPFVRPFDEKRIKEYAELSNKIGRLCKEYGVKACMHPHSNTAVFKKEEIDYYMQHADPEYVYLCVDTAHTTLAGINAPELVREYGKRIGYMHLKDLDPDSSLNPEWPMKRFRPLGYGCIDFKGVVQELRKAGYDGILCVELDYQPVCNYRSAQISRDYIHNVLGL
ncbi:MAG: sugar phosphate isomerase/epimerase [Lachnospiraceae bacterium]|nr:sugar phosphate isomerase/epimerase [Lachnospiraceae bacterium]